MKFILQSEKLNLNIITQKILATEKHSSVLEWIEDAYPISDIIHRLGSIAIFFTQQNGFYDKIIDTFIKSCGKTFNY